MAELHIVTKALPVLHSIIEFKITVTSASVPTSSVGLNDSVIGHFNSLNIMLSFTDLSIVNNNEYSINLQ